jgi:hypothetical protein
MKPTLSSRPLRLAATVILAALYLAASTVAATVNLAQSDQAVAPAPADARRLAAYFSPPYQAGPLPVADEILARSAPAELRIGCAAMVDSWGRSARGSSRVSIRILAVAGGSAWIAYRCDSRIPQFEGNYSERLAAFNSARRLIEFLDLKANEDTAATLYHIGLATTLKLRGAENSAAFVVFAVGSSPLQERSASRDSAAPQGQAENRYVVVANSATAARPVLVLVTARRRRGASVGGDAAGTEPTGADSSNSDEYRAALRFDHDLSGHLTAIEAYYRAAPPGARSRFGVLRYVWNPARFTFAAAKPLARPPRLQAPTRLPPVPGYHPPLY